MEGTPSTARVEGAGFETAVKSGPRSLLQQWQVVQKDLVESSLPEKIRRIWLCGHASLVWASFIMIDSSRLGEAAIQS